LETGSATLTQQYNEELLRRKSLEESAEAKEKEITVLSAELQKRADEMTNLKTKDQEAVELHEVLERRLQDAQNESLRNVQHVEQLNRELTAVTERLNDKVRQLPLLFMQKLTLLYARLRRQKN